MALQLWLFWGFSLVAPKFLALLAFFYFDSTHCQPTSRTGTRITEVFTRRSHLIMFLPQNSDAATRLNLLSTHLWHSPQSSTNKQVLNFIIIKESESGVLISGCATKRVKLRQEQICMFNMYVNDAVLRVPPLPKSVVVVPEIW